MFSLDIGSHEKPICLNIGLHELKGKTLWMYLGFSYGKIGKCEIEAYFGKSNCDDRMWLYQG